MVLFLKLLWQKRIKKGIEASHSDSLGIYITISALDIEQMMIACGAISLGVLFSLIPGLIAYKRSLQDGLMIKV
jgi:hypothetical protein